MYLVGDWGVPGRLTAVREPLEYTHSHPNNFAEKLLQEVSARLAAESMTVTPKTASIRMQLLFHRIYEMADMITAVVNEDDGSYAFDELAWDRTDVIGCLERFTKTSILGHFCFAHIRIHDLVRARKDPEEFHVAELEAALTRYEIPFASFSNFMRREFPAEQGDAYIELEHLHDWMSSQEEGAFGVLWEKMTDEAFHLLFGNRSFLLTFNLQLAQFRQRRGDSQSPRCSIPQWVKRAVYFRENGKCALCKSDLSGLIAIDPKQHYDHIVPLKSLGANDPCNIQLLCESCNLQKAASPAVTSSIYEPWWR